MPNALRTLCAYSRALSESVARGDRRLRELRFGRPVPQLKALKAGGSEIELLRRAKEEYTRRLLKKSPSYRLLPPALIPDMFLLALRNREGELKN